MFWNRTKKTTDKDQKSEDAPSEQSGNNAQRDHRVSKKIPLSFLKRLIPVSNLSDSDLQQLKFTLSQHKPGDIIFNRSESSDSLTYIIKGQCYIEASNGSGYEVDAATFKAYYPLSTDLQYQCTAIAKTDVNILHVPQSILRNSNTNHRNPLLNVTDISESLKNNAFFHAFCQHFRQDKLTIPSLPDVALKLRTAVQKDIAIKEAVKIVSLDPVISSKLIQIVNSPLYRTLNPITTCHDAINRLGLTTTRNLVTSISMKNLFKTTNKELNERVHQVWKHSIQVSSISHTLARLTKKTNPDEALLAGLIHNIGALPIIIFADSLNKNEYTSVEMDQTINALQGLLGNFILKKWGFPKALDTIPMQTENWYHSVGEKIELSDIVLLAKFHSYIGSKEMQNLPSINTLPAFKKLGDNALTPDMSLQTLQDAKQEIFDAISLFGS